MDTPNDREPPYRPRQMTPEERDAKLARLMEQNVQPGGWQLQQEACDDESTPTDDEPPYKPRQMTPEERDAKLARLMKEQNIQPDAWERLDGACLHLFESEAELEAFYAYLERTRDEKE